MGAEATREAIEVLAHWDGVSAIGQRQDASQVSKAPRLRKSDGEIDWSRTAKEIDCHVRGMQPWPVAFSHIKLNDDKPPVRVAIKQTRPTTLDSDGHATLGQGHGVRRDYAVTPR